MAPQDKVEPSKDTEEVLDNATDMTSKEASTDALETLETSKMAEMPKTTENSRTVETLEGIDTDKEFDYLELATTAHLAELPRYLIFPKNVEGSKSTKGHKKPETRDNTDTSKDIQTVKPATPGNTETSKNVEAIKPETVKPENGKPETVKPEILEKTETPKGPENPKDSKAPKNVEFPINLSLSNTIELPKNVETSENTGNVKPETPNNVEAPRNVEAPKTVEAPKKLKFPIELHGSFPSSAENFDAPPTSPAFAALTAAQKQQYTGPISEWAPRGNPQTHPDSKPPPPPEKKPEEPLKPQQPPREPSRWHPDPPLGFSNSVRFDRIPGAKPLDLLFNRLPNPIRDFKASWDPSTRDYLDKAFVFVLWGFANSDRSAVVAGAATPKSATMAGQLWDITRDAFTLEDPHDLNKIKNYFLQGLSQLIIETDNDNGLLLAGASMNGTTGRIPWGMFADWMSVGRLDKDSLGLIREKHGDVNELDAIQAWSCDACTGKIRKKVFYCGLCCDNQFKKMNGVRYCSKKCQAWAWDEHQQVCSQRRFFFRGVEIFKRLAHQYEVLSYTDLPREIVSPVQTFVHCAPRARHLEMMKKAKALKAGPGTNSVLHHVHLAWDQPDAYAVLRPLISNVFKGLCEQISILKVYMRNCRDTVIRVSDPSIKPGVAGRTTMKHPMFHPHSVLYLKIKDGEEFIIDLHSALFGFGPDVLPFDIFIRSRVACIISVSNALDASRAEEWAPECMRKIQLERHELMEAFLKRLKRVLQTQCKARNVQSSICQICHLHDAFYQDIRKKIYIFARDYHEGLASGNLPYQIE